MCHHFAKEIEAGNFNSLIDKDTKCSFCNEVTRVETTLRQGNQMIGEINIHHRQHIRYMADVPNSLYAYNPNKLARWMLGHSRDNMRLEVKLIWNPETDNNRMGWILLFIRDHICPTYVWDFLNIESVPAQKDRDSWLGNNPPTVSPKRLGKRNRRYHQVPGRTRMGRLQVDSALSNQYSLGQKHQGRQETLRSTASTLQGEVDNVANQRSRSRPS